MRVSPVLFPITVSLLSPEEEQNGMKKHEKPGEEQMSEKMFHFGRLS